MTLEENIRSWVRLDDEIRKLNTEIKGLRTQKEEYNNNILEYVKEKNLEHAIVKIKDGSLKFIDVNNQQTLTYKFICECLYDYFNEDDETVMNIIYYIKSKRVVKKNKEIKRYNIS
jgi:hypothetical protein